MTTRKKLNKRYITDLNDYSIWRWDKLTKSDDWSYLCREGQKPCKLAPGVYQSLIFQFDSLNLTKLQERRDIVLQVIDLIIAISELDLKEEEIEAINEVMQALVINPIAIPIDFMFKLIKEPDIKIQLSYIKLAKKNYTDNDKKKKQQTLNERVAQCAKAMNTHLDVKKVSIVQLMAYENEVFKTRK